MVVSTFFKVVKIGLVGGKSSLFGSGVDVGEVGADGVFRQGNVLSGGVKDFLLVRGEIDVNTVLKKDFLHEIRKLIKGGLVHFLKLFLPLRKEERKTDSNIIDFSGGVEVFGAEKVRRGDSVVLSEDGKNLVTFRRPKEGGLLIGERGEIGKLGEVGTTKKVVV